MNKKISFVGLVKTLFAAISNMYQSAMEPSTLFWDECALKNRIPALIVTSVTFSMEFLMLLFYIVNLYLKKQVEIPPQYIYIYASMVFFSFCFIVLLNIFKNSPKKLMRLQLIMLLIVGIWSGVFSAFDIKNGFSSYLFIQLMIINSLVFRTKPIKHILVNIISFIIYMIIILYSNLDITHIFAEIVNPMFMVIAACIVIVLSNHRAYVAYISQNLIKEQHEELEYYANYDFLTKIPSRKNIIEYLDELSQTNPRSIACMMIDIDNFKLYNDTYGHVMGDYCLIRLANVIHNYVIANGGRAGRYGGEEFLVLFANKESDFIIKTANELVNLVKDENIEFASSIDYKVATISIGVYIEKDTSYIDKEKLLVLSDDALYRAKRTGKNRACI